MAKDDALKILLEKSESVYKTVRVDLEYKDFLREFHKYKGKLLKFEECRDAYMSLITLYVINNLESAENYHEIEMGDIIFGADVERMDSQISEDLLRKTLKD